MFRFQVLKTFDNTVEYKTCEKRMINKEEATSYLKNYKYIAAYYAAAIMLFLSGPDIALSIYFATSENNYRPDTVIGSAVLLVAALAIFIVALQKSKKCRQIIKVHFDWKLKQKSI